MDCNDDDGCETSCVTNFKQEHRDCPCQVSLIPYAVQILLIAALKLNLNFKEKCPLGCPCDNYQCDLPDKKAILTLNSFDSVLIQPNGLHSISYIFKFDTSR